MHGCQLRPQRALLLAAEAVEQVELGGGHGQAPVLVLPEEGHEPPAQLAQVRRGRATLDEGARTPLPADPPGQDQLVGVLRDALAQVGELGLVEQPVRELEDPHVRLARARAHDPGLGLAAQEQVQRVREHGLATAPVSPVMALSPGPGRSSALSMSRRFSMHSSSSTPASLAR